MKRKRKNLELIRDALDKWMAVHDQTDDDVARAIERDRMTVSGFRNGRTVPQRQTLRRISILIDFKEPA